MIPSVTRANSLAVVGAFAGIYFIWGTTYLAIAVVIQTMPPFIGGAARFLLAGALMYAWLRVRQPRPFAGLNLPLTALCGVLLSGIGNGFVMWAQQGIPTGIAALIVAAVPVVVLVLDWAFFSRQAPTRQALLGVSIALVGVVTIVMHTHAVSGAARPLHLLAMIAAPLAWSWGTLLQKRLAKADTVLSFTCAQMLFGGLFQIGMASIDGEWARLDLDRISVASALAVLYLMVFGSIVALNCYLWLLTRVSAQKVTTYALVNPVVALVLGWFALNERVTPLTLAAAALVLVGVALVLFQSRRTLALADTPKAGLKSGLQR
jgi:drug/metabolite transporter (DMT)-like permease